MENLKESKNCPNCGSMDREVVFQALSGTQVKCKKCKTEYIYTPPEEPIYAMGSDGRIN